MTIGTCLKIYFYVLPKMSLTTIEYTTQLIHKITNSLFLVFQCEHIPNNGIHLFVIHIHSQLICQFIPQAFTVAIHYLAVLFTRGKLTQQID